MYCSHCGTPLFYKDLEDASFCDHCKTVVKVSPCKVSFWNLMAVFVIFWTLQVGI